MQRILDRVAKLKEGVEPGNDGPLSRAVRNALVRKRRRRYGFCLVMDRMDRTETEAGMRILLRRATPAVALATALMCSTLVTACEGTSETHRQEAAEEQTSADLSIAYDPDTLAWLREGRPVKFQDVDWIPVGSPIYDPTVIPVGEFEGMKLYAPQNETEPYRHLLFPVGDDRWQTLEPMQPGAVDTTGTDTAGAARDTTAG